MSENLSRYNILILINVRWWNATAFYAVNIARILHYNRHKVIIGCNKNYPAYKIAGSYGLRTEPLSFYGYNIIQLMRNFIRMLKLIKKENIQIINSHRSEDHTFAFLARWFTGVRVILTRGDRRKISSNFLSNMRYRLSDAVILTCQSIYDQNKNIFLPVKNKVSIIYGSVDEEHFRIINPKKKTANKYMVDLEKKIVGIAGRTDYVKDQYTFIKAASLVAKKIKNVSFIITGKEERIKFAELKKMFKDLKIEKNILLLPKVDDIADIINLFDICVITSIDSETISRVLLEYMYLKKPIIGTNVNTIGEIVKPVYNGELFKPEDYKTLAEHIIKLLENSSLRKKYSLNSYKLYKKKYSEEIFYNQYMEVFTKISSGKEVI